MRDAGGTGSTMHRAALSAGGQAPSGRFNGAVHSAFRQTCTIRLDDGRMLALLTPYLGNVPHGARVAVPTGCACADHLTVGRPVGCRADVLRIAGCELPPAGIDLELPAIAQAWRAAWTAPATPFIDLDGLAHG